MGDISDSEEELMDVSEPDFLADEEEEEQEEDLAYEMDGDYL